MYADDSQFHASCRPDDTDSLRTRLSSCANDIISWCMSRCLQLDASKDRPSGSGRGPVWLFNRDCSIQIGTSTIQPTTVVRHLGKYLDSERSTYSQSSRVVLHQIRRRVGSEITTCLVLALLMSRLDYCNSVLADLPLVTIAPLQRVQNATARLSWVLASMSRRASFSCIGCRSVGGSSSSCAVSCTQLSTGSARTISPTS